MKNNDQPQTTDTMTDSRCDQNIDRYFDNYTLPHVDTTSIEVHTHMKILRDGLMRSRRRWRLLTMTTAAACLALIFIISGLLLSPEHPDAGSPTLYADTDNTCIYNETIVPTGQRMTIMLPDGTRMIANSRSTLRYPSRFTGDKRTVWATGEVYFDVAKDPTKPFIVSTKGFDIKVYGTRFNISNYDPDQAGVLLIEGSVSVTTHNDEHVNLRPGHLVTIERGAIDEVRNVDPTPYTSWIDGGLLLTDRTLSDIAHQLSTYYDVAIHVDPALADSRLYGCLDLKSDIDDIIDVLTTIVPMTVSNDTDGYRLSPRQ
ncbi:MAG: DUF4974 domain-containing protein [Bacteroides sp.]|nr:DUF4974 domain-containing protein [Bacteroides sp.]